MLAKSKPFRSESYRRWVASLPCVACGIEGYSQCAHENGGGMGTKTSDLRTFPLCCTLPGRVGCHVRYDQCIGIYKQERKDMTILYIAKTQAMALKARRPEVMSIEP
jgi:hypothetical protein